MSFWERLQSVIEQARRRTLGAALDALAARKARRDEAAFSIALIALSAKMAKADGVVTDEEITAFRHFFSYPESEAGKVRLIYNLAQQDVAGFDAYLSRVARLFVDAPQVLEDVLDCLFYVAGADGVEHPRERELLEMAARTFGVSGAAFRRLRAVHMGLDADDPYAILGVDPDASPQAIKAAYRALVREHHPDALIARGVPPALARIGEARTAAINEAYRIALAQAKMEARAG
ncbi:molecular chaperone DjiA [Amphiplicatus metriothermophilus]|uniref:DnaJ like chaperone protein n=1 Tax=Amphiplicatus metriothermophilus TaxID=1519374 RepID=A0A239Q0M4_9PROT|nr:molecular chaperone DjiA [Amphiplicatus metriothermophilus]MBB5520154.1 DnaJ like chaperone protein [Amphiplicatus metriothermophilus]SNT75742.1 DnaJ like chaperone protein [Amphiplicatus metriothermophilus]